MARSGAYHRARALAVRLNRYLAQNRSFGEIKKITLLAYGLTLIISVALLALPLMQKLPKLAAGEVAQQDVKALMDLRISDPAETERLKKNAFERERPAFDRDYAVYEKMLQQLKTDFTWIARTIVETRAQAADKRIALLTERLPFLASGTVVRWVNPCF